MALRKWDDLPEEMKNESVRKYYEILDKKRLSLFFNRMLDVMLGIIIFIIISPLFLTVSIAIRADSCGPVLFRQDRITQYGKLFKMYKFRTMVENAENIGPIITARHDERITRVGRYLRDKRLDEIPQLFNVIKGDMTFVGTRPEVAKFVGRYTDEMMATLLLKAGVTSETSIRYKDERKILNSADDIEKAYLKYILPEKMKINLKSIEEYDIQKTVGTITKTFFTFIEKNDDAAETDDEIPG